MASYEKEECNQCGKVFNKKWRLVEHQRSHTGERPYKCTHEGCDKTFIRAYHQKRHEQSHLDEKPFKCGYPECNMSFSIKHSLKRHEKRAHDNPFKCTHEGCSKSFSKGTQLRKHQCAHENKLPFCCDKEGCDEMFPTTQKLKNHIKRHEKSFICSVQECGQGFESFHKLRTHITTHDYKCSICGLLFKDKVEVKRHAVVHNALRQVYKCPRPGCEKCYTKAFNLKVHIKTYHDAERLICSFENCGKEFLYSRSLARHLLTHTKIKPKPGKNVFKCPESSCDKFYTTAYIRKLHIETCHEGIKTFVCSVENCGKTFSFQRSLKRHVDKQHPKSKSSKSKKKKKKNKKKKRRKEKSQKVDRKGEAPTTNQISDTQEMETETSNANRQAAPTRVAETKSGEKRDDNTNCFRKPTDDDKDQPSTEAELMASNGIQHVGDDAVGIGGVQGHCLDDRACEVHEKDDEDQPSTEAELMVSNETQHVGDDAVDISGVQGHCPDDRACDVDETNRQDAVLVN